MRNSVFFAVKRSTWKKKPNNNMRVDKMSKTSTWWICGPWCPPDIWAVGVLANMCNQLVERSHHGPSALSAQMAETWLSDIQEKWAWIWFDSIWSPSFPFPTYTYIFMSDIRPQEGRKSELDQWKCRPSPRFNSLKQHCGFSLYVKKAIWCIIIWFTTRSKLHCKLQWPYYEG